MSESLGVQEARRRLLELRGSGRGYWPQALGSSQPTPQARPDSAAATPVSGSPFDLHQLHRGALIGFEASALIALLSGAADSGGLLTQLLEGIAQGFWRGQISSLCLMRLLEGPLIQGHEGRAQSYRQVFADGQAWQVVAADGAVVEAAARLRRPHPCRTQPSGGHLSAGAALELAAAIQAGAAVLVSDDAELLHGRALLPALDLPVVPSC